jgi:trans-aconitate 2-methyltransferase
MNSSPVMLARAMATLPKPEFQLASFTNWQLNPTAHLLVGNATFQWLPQHITILQSYLRHMQAGAVLAPQMPGNLNELSHVLMRDVALSGPGGQKTPPVSRAEMSLST